jgi:DNA polymerase III subunit beta
MVMHVLSMIVPAGRGQVVFRLDSAELVSQLIDGNFPDYKVIMPRSLSRTLSFPRLLSSKPAVRLRLLPETVITWCALNLQPMSDRPGQVEVSAQSEETGSNETIIDATIDGPGLVVAFNVRFLREVLEIVKTPNLVLETNDHKSPARVQPVGDENFQHVIMPMHLG